MNVALHLEMLYLGVTKPQIHEKKSCPNSCFIGIDYSKSEF